MARRIQLRRDTAAAWSASNPVLAQGEIGIDLTNNKLKIGNGTTAWNSLGYWDDKEPSGFDGTYASLTGKPELFSGSYDDLTDKPAIPDLSNVTQDIVPDLDNAHDLGSPTKQWRHVYTAGGSIYLDNIKLTNVNGKFTATKVINPGEEDEAEDPEDSDATSELRGGSISVGDGQGPSIENVTEILINGTVTEIEPGLVGISVSGGSGLGTITVPAEVGTTYKGLQVAYGMIHSNLNSNELNVNKIVIHKPAVATVTIDEQGGNTDAFQVSGIGNSDILAMFVLYGDVNGAKSTATLGAFARAAIDNVILNGGVEGQYNTVDQMKAAFSGNYQILASAAGGLDSDFQFYQNNVSTVDAGEQTGVTTIREGSGAVFEIADAGDGTYSTVGTLNPGSNYREGHQIKVLGTDLGGVTPDNDCIITLGPVGENGGVFVWNVSGTAAGTVPTVYSPVSGTNYNVGSGFRVSSINLNNNILEASVFGFGSNYVVGDVLTLPGTSLTGGTSPANDMTLTVTSVGADPGMKGPAFNVTVEGTLPQVWYSNYIGDGGNDQYDSGNYLNTNLQNEISYNSGNTVTDSVAFGTGSSYSVAYETGIFALFVTGNSAQYISTSGGSGANGESVTVAGHLYGPSTLSQTFDNAVTHLNLVDSLYVGPEVSFVKTDNGSEVDILIADDGLGAGVGITRDGQNGIYNLYRDDGWTSNVSPSGTLWNVDGWTDFSDVESRTYTNLFAAFGNGGLGNKIVGTECVMYLPDNGKYYAVKFSQWTQGANGGGFAYTRRELNLNSLQKGIRFSDGTVLDSAEGVGRVKLRAPNNRRIEEVYGYKSVSVTSKQYTSLQTTASRSATDTNLFWFDTTTTIDDVLNGPSTYGIWEVLTAPGIIQFSLDGNIWYNYNGSISGNGNEWGVGVTGATVSYNQGDTIYFRYRNGGQPVVWWDSADLPGGSGNFRGAIIKYHAYITDAGSMVGTIHIAKDSGDDNVAHTEVLSGGTDGENAVLWYQDNENQLKYWRVDTEGSTVKIQWSATVFYGSEVWD